MEAFSLAAGVILMLVAAIGIVLYVALVIAIPVCRFIDWIGGERPDAPPRQATARRVENLAQLVRRRAMKLIGRRRFAP